MQSAQPPARVSELRCLGISMMFPEHATVLLLLGEVVAFN